MILILVIIAGLAEGIMDYIWFHYKGDNSFLNPDLSWRNKWKHGNPKYGERFFLSSTILVFLTDGWHLMKWTRNRSIDLCVFIVSAELLSVWLGILITVGLRVSYNASFQIIYSLLSRKK